MSHNKLTQATQRCSRKKALRIEILSHQPSLNKTNEIAYSKAEIVIYVNHFRFIFLDEKSREKSIVTITIAMISSTFSNDKCSESRHTQRIYANTGII